MPLDKAASKAPVSLALFTTGLALVIAGACVILTQDLRVTFASYVIEIPYYVFETATPGRYVSTKVQTLYLATLERETVAPETWVYNATAMLHNCSGGRRLVTWATGRRVEPAGSVGLTLEVQGCKRGACELLVSDDLAARRVEERAGFVASWYEYELEKGILDFDHLTVRLEPRGLAVQKFCVYTTVTCTYVYEVTAPTLTLKSSGTRPYVISTPQYIDATGLRLGLGLSLSGLAALAASPYVHALEARLTRPEQRAERDNA